MMMLDDGTTRFELSIRGYEFPALEHAEEDSNWLVIATTLRVPKGEHSAESACLMTDEAAWLALWLENIAGGLAQTPYLNALEPNLAFVQVGSDGETISLRIRLDQEMRPPWADDSVDVFGVDLQVSRARVRAAADSLRAQLARFPPRDGWDRERPFVPPVLLPHCIVDWVLYVPGRTNEEARAEAERYFRAQAIDAEVGSSVTAQRDPEHRFVRAVTALATRGDQPLPAVTELFARVPATRRQLREGEPYLSPDGVLHFTSKPAQEAAGGEDDGIQVRVWFTVKNVAGNPRFFPDPRLPPEVR